MRILIDTPLYPPGIGGPSYYARGVEEAWREEGNTVTVRAFDAYLAYPPLIRNVLYGISLVRPALTADVILILDTFSVALPAVTVGTLLRKKTLIRTGGDFLWEQYLTRTGHLLPLPFFYTDHRPFSWKERVIYTLTRWILFFTTHIVYSTALQRDLWERAYGVPHAKASLVDNAYEALVPGTAPTQKNFLWYTRSITMKNPENVQKGFALARAEHPTITLESGTLPKEELLARMAGSYAVILPSLCEISPNYLLDALRMHKPFIYDKHSGLADLFAPYGTAVDPLSPTDIARALGELATEEGYARARVRVEQWQTVRPYRAVAADIMEVIQSL